MLITGYHGTTLLSAEAILAGSPMRPSLNEGDWLGKGSYFFEDGKERAIFWATLFCKEAGGTPAVLEAQIDLSDCFDLIDLYDFGLLEDIYPHFLAEFGDEPSQEPLEVRRGRVRPPAAGLPLHLRNKRDRALIDYSVEWLGRRFGRTVTTVRSPFTWGHAVYRESCFFNWNRVEVAVREPQAIRGMRLADVGPVTYPTP